MTVSDRSIRTLLDPPALTRLRGGLFVVIEGPDIGESVALGEGPVSIGTSDDSALVLTDRTVSGRHLTAHRDGPHAVLRDEGSTNGSHFQGARFDQITVAYGAQIRVGRTALKYVPEEQGVEPEPAESASFGSLLGACTAMRRLFSMLEAYAPLDATVLIEGPTGTGKELVAREIHAHSPRAEEPFVIFDAGSVSRELIASALFGHTKGAFTGAIADRAGAFARANGGTLFLDEIGELPLELQPTLLRALDQKTVCAVGADRYEAFDVRIVAATNRNLRDAILRGSYREDLYYRLAVARIALPALKDREGDIALLAGHMIEQHANGRSLEATQEELAKLARYSWPGNVRELRNVVERACMLAKDGRLQFDIDDSQQAIEPRSPPSRGERVFKAAKAAVIESFEREYVVDLLKRHDMSITSAAREAELSRKYLRALALRYGIVSTSGAEDENDSR